MEQALASPAASTDVVQDTSDSLSRIDSGLRPLIDPLRQAIDNSCTVVALQLWYRTPYIPLLPFHLHLRWTDEINALPLTARITLAPFFESDFSLTATPLYRVGDANLSRRRARFERRETCRARPNDMMHPDWEAALGRRRAQLEDRILPGASYLAIDRVSPNGTVTRGHRPYLGRYALRTAPRPSVTVPSARGVSETSALYLSSADSLIIDLQGLRGRRALESVRRLSKARGTNRPTLIVASSPSEILAFDCGEPLENALYVFLGRAPRVPWVHVTAVGRERLLAERGFGFAVEELRGYSPLIDDAVDAAKSAWWAVHQAVSEDVDSQPEYRRFMSMLERLRSDHADEANVLTAAADVLGRAAGDSERFRERLDAVVKAVLTSGGNSGVLVIARDGAAARRLRQEIACRLEIPAGSLAELGVQVQTHHAPPPSIPPSVAVLAGYFGLAALDSILSSGAPEARLVFDPIESRAAWYGAKKMAEFLTRAGDKQGALTLAGLVNALGPHVPPPSSAAALSLSVGYSSHFDPSASPTRVQPSATDHVAICLTDGTQLEVALRSRLEVLTPPTGRLRTVVATEVQPGDQLVLLQEDERTLFSQRLMTVLDQGPLREAAEKRITWLTIVRSLDGQRRINVSEVKRRMETAGQSVDYATVRSWIRFSDYSDGTVPDTYTHFVAFAEALDVALPAEQLSEYFRCIRRWRILHRKYGRQLSKVLRAAHADKLDAITLAKVEREWGLDARALLQGTRVAIVDEVLLPGGVDEPD